MVKNVDHMRSFLALLVLVKFYGESIASVYSINLNRCNNECCFVLLSLSLSLSLLVLYHSTFVSDVAVGRVPDGGAAPPPPPRW